jgi:hypothetical protein
MFKRKNSTLVIPMNNPNDSHSDEIEDLETCSREGRQPRCDRKYRFKVDKEHYVSPVTFMFGRQILEMAGKCHPEKWKLRQQFAGGQLKKVGLDDQVDFTTPGVEKFLTLPCDQQEG